jgi:murein DD-endopeptidase MepM/ murein hydrolase activator NlpD
VRRLQAGKPYRVYRNAWLGKARYLVYRPSAVEYVVFDVRFPERSFVGAREVQTAWRTVEGTITHSLYQSLDDAGAHPSLALALSEVFAWQVDFFRIQRGDRFRVVFEERRVDGRRIEPGKVVAARFAHHEDDYFAFRFDAGDAGDAGASAYFDENGNSLRKALLKAPLRYSRISSHYSRRRLHPVLKRYRPHLGVDYAAPYGTPVRSVGDGKVLFAARKGGNGNYVKIRHNATYTTGYLHLQRFAEGVRPGARVKQGQVIGYVGSTGLSTGPHLDYRFWKNGAAINPLAVDLPPGEPVAPPYRAAFEAVRDGLMPYLTEPIVPPHRLAMAF